MNKTYHLHTSQLRAAIDQLQAGDRVLLTGTIYTARDAAHKRLFTLLDEGKALPFPLKDAVIYYAGPTPAQQGLPMGACGPTTASRMNAFAPRLLDLGLAAIIGKGQMSQDVAATTAASSPPWAAPERLSPGVSMWRTSSPLMSWAVNPSSGSKWRSCP